VVQRSVGLSASTLEAIASLERRVVAADGGRLKLEWNALRSRAGRDVEDLLWWSGGRLLGFLGIYSHGAPVLELAGMVDPDFRRRGIGAALVEEALQVCRERAHTATLLVVPRASEAGRALALRRGGTLDHSEHAMRLLGPPNEVRVDPLVTVRAATSEDLPAVSELLDGGLDDPNILVVEREREVIGTVRLIPEGDTAGVYGFVIRPDHRGRGIGRDVLRRLCLMARADGATSVNLEVATDNDRALNVYTSLGFTQVTTEDYYALPD